MRKIGVITIGEAPRTDLIPEMAHFLPENVTFMERGVLDDLSDAKLTALYPDPGQTTLVSRKKNGTSVIMAKEKIIPIIQSIIDDFNQTVDVIILACTGAFQVFSSNIPVIYPDHLLSRVAQGLFKDKGKLGVIVPLPEQTDSIKEKWALAGFQVRTATSSPYQFNQTSLIEATLALEVQPVQMIVLDCIGYTQEMKHIVQKHTNKPVVLSRNIVFKTTAELF